jgi:hypothetical protein
MKMAVGAGVVRHQKAMVMHSTKARSVVFIVSCMKLNAVRLSLDYTLTICVEFVIAQILNILSQLHAVRICIAQL